MRVMFCLGSMAKGGAERVVANLANYFINKNEVSIIVTSPKSIGYQLDKNICFKCLDSPNKKKSNLILRTIQRIKVLKKYIKEINPEIIVSFLPEPTFRVMIATFFHRRKVIISVRNDPNREYNTFLKKMIVSVLYSRADGFVFQTYDAQQWFSKKIQKKSIVIANPINEDFIGKPFSGTRKKEIVTVGRLVEQKNHKLLIEAFHDVLKKHRDYILKIYGEGILKKDLVELVDRLKINNYVRFMGQKDCIKDEIYKSALFVLSSDYEGMPNALMEAMALGIPCISTNCPIGGPRYLIKNNENGILININDKVALTNAINLLIENNDLSAKIGNNANKICQELNPRKINNQWEKYILEVLNK